MSSTRSIYDPNRIYSPSYIRDVLKLHAVFLKKNLGQNFLFDKHALEKIVQTAEVRSDDIVLEIGSGMGHLTVALLERVQHVVSVEIDSRLLSIMQAILGKHPGLTLVEADILNVDLAARFRDLGQYPTTLVANVPYYITTPIFLHLLDAGIPFRSATFTVQKELAERYIAEPGSREYRAISVFIRYWGVPRLGPVIPASCFFPRPRVDSRILTIAPHDVPPVGLPDKALFFRLVRLAFSARRKKISNALIALDKEGYPLDAALDQAGIDSTLRPDTLTLEQYARLTEALVIQAARRME